MSDWSWSALRLEFPLIADDILLSAIDHTFRPEDLYKLDSDRTRRRERVGLDSHGRAVHFDTQSGQGPGTVGTAVVVAAVGRIGHDGKDIVLPAHEGALGPVARGLYERITEIQEGRVEWEGWSVPCA